MLNCNKCHVPVDGLLWWKDKWYCWQHFLDVTATERVRVGSLSLMDDVTIEEVRARARARNDVY